MNARMPLLLLLSSLHVLPIALAETTPEWATASHVGGSGSQLRLVHVAVLFRHGERAPLTSFSGDPNRHYTWPMGHGQLTNRGRQTMWALGKWLRARYAHFLTSDVREVSARSSPVPRCFDSVAILLYGLYPAVDKERQWKHGQDWQPVPITSVPDGTDKYATPCLPRFLESLSALYATEVPLSLVGEQAARPPSPRAEPDPATAGPRSFATASNILEFVATAANVTDKPGVARFMAIARIVDALLLIWLNEMLVELIGKYQKDNMAGALLKDFVASMKPGHAGGGVMLTQGQDETNKAPKVTLYSYHDMNVAGALVGLNGTLSGRPSCGAAIILEVFARSGASDTAADKFVRLLYKAGDQHATNIPVEGCADPCPLQKFNEILERKFKPVTRAQCGWSEHQPLL
ncbi:hypothetical protein HPB52_001944 [Rhipicephalus sanguineus]|uniref:Uncharacterized protein n=1 Tax=Rhipicephalus sanguineus TaxID=34632 RepID=A0A9D4PQE9_RHISA|nr:hypothetical protein HPB52_001944 [Rhipicephalus sanguineus]